jgi:mRNA-degrading endonuclease toxin of MazEF toxin-antitoxin module
VVRPPASLGESIHNADNSQTVPRVRFMRYLGVLESETMRAVGRKVFLALALEDLI